MLPAIIPGQLNLLPVRADTFLKHPACSEEYPCDKSPASIPVSTSPLPPVAIPGLPVLLKYTFPHGTCEHAIKALYYNNTFNSPAFFLLFLTGRSLYRLYQTVFQILLGAV
jgi:hypothetical protein